MSDEVSVSTKRRWRIIAVLVYVAMTSVAAFTQVYSPEHAVSAGYFVGTPPYGDESYLTDFPDLGYLAEEVDGLTPDQGGLVTDWWDAWKYGANWNDALIYIRTAQSWTSPPAPYRYRPFVPYLVGAIHRLTGAPVPLVFLILNTAAVILAALIFNGYLQRFHGYNRTTALLGGCLFIFSGAVAGTVAYPLIDPVVLLWVVLLFWGVRANDRVLFIVVSIVGVLTKGVLAIAGPLYLCVHFRREAGVRGNVPTVLITLVPIAAYVLVKVLFGGAVDEVSSGYHLLKGELPVFAFRLFRWSGLAEIAGKVFFSFTFLWAGLLNLGRDRFLRLSFFVVGVPVAAASVLFSSSIARPLGVLYPVIIPLFLIFIQRLTGESRLTANDPEGLSAS
jgi:hypothetical protein